MSHIFLVILAFLLALTGGTGLYMTMPLLLNILLTSSVLMICWLWYKQYALTGITAFNIDTKKNYVLFLYIFFLMGNTLKETIYYSEYQFSTQEGIFRQYTDYFRGLVTFLITATIYSYTKNSKFLIILPLLSLVVIIIGQYLEINQVISFKSVTRDDDWEPTPEEALVGRPGGFVNANMTAALALIWFYVAIESKQNTSITIKGLVFLLTTVICLLTQSRAGLIFFLLYIIYKLIILRNFKFLLFLTIFGLVGSVLSFYFNPEISQEIIDNFTSRADSHEGSAVERLYLIHLAINSFLDSPVLGNGIYYLQKAAGVGLSSHNQILEILANFGIIGFIVMALVYITHYHNNSFLYLSICIFPTLFFSHNFFDALEYQVALAYAYVTSRHNILDKKYG